jgi:cathepsin L
MVRLFSLLAFVAIAVAVRDIADEDIPKYTFEEYILDWGKSYPSHIEYKMRKDLFELRKAQIIRQNSDVYGTWKAGFNKFTDMTEAEFKAFRGYNSRMAAQSTAPRASLSSGQAIPASVDWRNVPGVLTPIKDQGQCGSCWAFAATEDLESAYAIWQKTAAPVLSPQNIVSCTPNPYNCGGSGGCNGATAELAFQYVSNNGIFMDSVWPYQGTTGKCTLPQGQSPAVTCTGYAKLMSNNYTALHEAVVVQPIAVSVDASTWNLYSSGIYNCTNATLDIDHAVQLVGYGSENGQDYWIVRNSWGTSWGENGYIRLLRHSDGSSEWCWPDTTPQDGSGCTNGPPSITVCGTCGIWYDSSVPVGAQKWSVP